MRSKERISRRANPVKRAAKETLMKRLKTRAARIKSLSLVAREVRSKK